MLSHTEFPQCHDDTVLSQTGSGSPSGRSSVASSFLPDQARAYKTCKNRIILCLGCLFLTALVCGIYKFAFCNADLAEDDASNVTGSEAPSLTQPNTSSNQVSAETPDADAQDASMETQPEQQDSIQVPVETQPEPSCLRAPDAQDLALITSLMFEARKLSVHSNQVVAVATEPNNYGLYYFKIQLAQYPSEGGQYIHVRIAPEWDGTPQVTWVEIQKSKDDNFHKDNQSCATCSEIVDAMLSQSAANQAVIVGNGPNPSQPPVVTQSGSPPTGADIESVAAQPNPYQSTNYPCRCASLPAGSLCTSCRARDVVGMILSRDPTPRIFSNPELH